MGEGTKAVRELGGQALGAPGCYSPAGDREPSDRAIWPGPLEAEAVPADLAECDVCRQVCGSAVVSPGAPNVYVCSDCLWEQDVAFERARILGLPGQKG